MPVTVIVHAWPFCGDFFGVYGLQGGPLGKNVYELRVLLGRPRHSITERWPSQDELFPLVLTPPLYEVNRALRENTLTVDTLNYVVPHHHDPPLEFFEAIATVFEHYGPGSINITEAIKEAIAVLNGFMAAYGIDYRMPVDLTWSDWGDDDRRSILEAARRVLKRHEDRERVYRVAERILGYIERLIEEMGKKPDSEIL